MQSKLKMRHFEAVIALAEEMHYGRAAQRVGLTQSGLSRCIQSAEREARAILFERNRAGMELSDAGRSYVEHARVAVAFGERAMRSAKAREADPAWGSATTDIHSQWWSKRIERQKLIDASIAAKAEFEFLYDKPYEDNKKVRVAGPFTVESLSPHRVLARRKGRGLPTGAKRRRP